MIRFMLQKLLHKKWMVISLLIGNILLVAIACSNPMYKNASLQRTLTEDFANYLQETNNNPSTISMGSSFSKGKEQQGDFDTMRTAAETMADELGVKQTNLIEFFTTNRARANSTMKREDNQRVHTMTIASMSNLKDHVKMISGEMYSDTADEDGVLEAIVSQRLIAKMNMILGETVEFPTIKMSNGESAKIKIVGVYTNKEANDSYWVKSPTKYASECFVSEKLFEKNFMQLSKKAYSWKANWYVQFDYSKLEPRQVSGLLEDTKAMLKQYSSRSTHMDSPDYLEVLEGFSKTEKKISTTLLILQVPVLVLLCAFIFMISRQMLDLEQNEIAMLKSRGSSKMQIITIYLLQSVFISLVSAVIGLPIGSFLCRALGSTNGFLEFIQRRALEVKLDGQVAFYCLGAMAISVAVMVLPVIKDANVTIVNYKQKKNRKGKPLWQRAYIDIILLGASLYGLYSFYDRQDALIAKMIGGASLDPVLFTCSSLFIISTALVALRIQPLLVQVVFMIGKRKWKPAPFASFLQIIRTKGKQSFMMVFLMLTVALGIYNATVARTILSNAEKGIRYSDGADIVFQEVWKDNSSFISAQAASGGSTEDMELVYTEPDTERFEELKGVDKMTKVLLRDDVQVKRNVGTYKASVMGINTKEFGEVSTFDSELLPEHYNNYLNVLSKNSNAVLLSSNFRDKLKYKVGDTFNYSNEDGKSIAAVVYGFVEYWPTYIPEAKTISEKGELEVNDQYLIIAHLGTVQEAWGITPYQVWMKTNGSSQFIYDYANETGTNFLLFRDMAADMVAVRNATLFQGTNGILTMSFIVVLILCSAGFLIYWILSIRSRELLFGVFRAMGMKKSEIIQMLINEQVFSSGISIAIGTVIGIVASKLFVPLVQIFYSSTDQAVPLEVIRQSSDMVRLFIVIAFVIMVCMVVLGMLISKIKISQALKLGED